MKFKRIIITLVIATLSLGAFTACADTNSTENINPSDYYTSEGFFKGITPSDYVTIDGYKDIEIPDEVLKADPNMVEGELQALLAQFTQKVESTDAHTVVDGDTLNIDYVGSVDGVEFEGGSTQGAGTEVTIGKTQYIDRFLEQLVGKQVGTTFDINVTFPEEYHSPDLSGKDAVFNITINSVIKDVIPELTDEFINEASDGFFETADAYIEQVELAIVKEQKISYLNKELLSLAVFTSVPQELIEYYTEIKVDEVTRTAMSYGVTNDEFLKQFGFKSMEEYLQAEASNIELISKITLILEYIANAEGLSATSDEFETYFEGVEYSEYEEGWGENYIISRIILEKVYEVF